MELVELHMCWVVSADKVVGNGSDRSDKDNDGIGARWIGGEIQR